MMTAAVDSNGHYQVAMAEGRGLPLGEYQVRVVPPPVEVAFGQPIAEPADSGNIPPRYRDVATSGLTLRVTSGGNRFDIDMLP